MKKLTLALLLSMASTAPAQDDGEKRITREIQPPQRHALDLKFDLGAGLGDYKADSGSAKSFGGLLLGLSWISDSIFASGSPFLQVHALLDLANEQTVRKGLAIGQYFYVWGGKKQTVERSPIAQIVTASAMSLSIPLRISQHFFSASPTQPGAPKLDGTTLNLGTGLAFSWNSSRGSSLGAEFIVTVLSLSNSIEKATESGSEIQLNYRFFL